MILKSMLALRNNWNRLTQYHAIIWIVMHTMACSGINYWLRRNASTTARWYRTRNWSVCLTKQLIKFVWLRSGIDWNSSMGFDNKIKIIFVFCLNRSWRRAFIPFVLIVELAVEGACARAHHSRDLSALFTFSMQRYCFESYFQYEMCTKMIITWVHLWSAWVENSQYTMPKYVWMYRW